VQEGLDFGSVAAPLRALSTARSDGPGRVTRRSARISRRRRRRRRVPSRSMRMPFETPPFDTACGGVQDKLL